MKFSGAIRRKGVVKDEGQTLRITKTRHTDVGPTLKMKKIISNTKTHPQRPDNTEFVKIC